MTIKVAHGKLLRSNSNRRGCCSGIVALLICLSCENLQSANAKDVETTFATAGSTGAAQHRLPAAALKPVLLAQASTVSDSGNATATDVISGRGFWQGMPSADPVQAPPAANARVTAAPASPPSAAPVGPPPRRPMATASAGPKSAPWPLADHKDQEPFPNALPYAAQPSPIATRALQTIPSKSHVTGHGDTTIAVKYSDEGAPAAPPRNEAALKATPLPPAAKKPVASVVRVGDRFNDPWMRAVIVTPSAQDYMETTLLGAPDFRSLGPYLAKPASAVALAFADDPHPGMSTDRFAGNPVTFVSTVPFGAPRPPPSR